MSEENKTPETTQEAAPQESRFKKFLNKKNIVISGKRYGIDALGAMAQGLFASLLIGTIIATLGEQCAKIVPEGWTVLEKICAYFVTIGTYATKALALVAEVPNVTPRAVGAFLKSRKELIYGCFFEVGSDHWMFDFLNCYVFSMSHMTLEKT